MCVLRDHFSAIIKISLFMSNFAKGYNSKNAWILIEKIKYIFFLKYSLGYLHIILYQLFKFFSKLLAVGVFEISSFLCSNLQRAMTDIFLFFTRKSTHFLYQLTKFGAPSCNNVCDILITKFHNDP